MISKDMQVTVIIKRVSVANYALTYRPVSPGAMTVVKISILL